MSESARCLQCVHAKSSDHRCSGYTYPHATYRCGCICQHPDELRQMLDGREGKP